MHFQQDGTSPYFGALVGRVANRIAEATFELDGEIYHVSANENTTSLHGGKVGFSKRVWKGHVFSEGEDSGVMLRYESPDGEEVIHSRVLIDMSADVTHGHAVCCGRCADTKSIDQMRIHLRATHAPQTLHAFNTYQTVYMCTWHMHLVLCMRAQGSNTDCTHLAVLLQLAYRSPLQYSISTYMLHICPQSCQAFAHISGRCPCQIKILHSLAWSWQYQAMTSLSLDMQQSKFMPASTAAEPPHGHAQHTHSQSEYAGRHEPSQLSVALLTHMCCRAIQAV